MIGQHFERINSIKDVDQFKLSDEQIRLYQKNGSISSLKIMSDNTLNTLRNDLSDIVNGRIDTSFATDLNHEAFKGYEGKGTNDELIYFQGAWLLTEAFHDIIYNPRITVPVSQLLGIDKVRFLHDQFFYKPPQHGLNIAWHQDYSYWQRTGPEKHISIWIPLDDADESNGTLQFIPGSQTWPLLPTVDLAGGDMEALKQHLTKEQRDSFSATAITMKAGQAEMHGSRVIHGSMPNTADTPRRALVLNYMEAHTISKDSTQPIMPGFPVIPEGEIIAGKGFPLVYDSNNPTQFFN